MRLYFDTNVYAFVTALGEEEEAADLLREYSASVAASDTNLEEILAIADDDKRHRELSTFASLFHNWPQQPDSWSDAEELRREIHRLRPSWLRSHSVARGRVQQWRRTHRRKWMSVRCREFGWLDALSLDREAMEVGRSLVGAAQKVMRRAGRNPDTELRFSRRDSGVEVRTLGLGADPEKHWRAYGLMAWYHAVQERVPGTAGHREWMAPHLKLGAFAAGESYDQFWTNDVSGAALPRNRLVGLVDYYQLEHRVTHGNAGDKKHACSLSKVDVFITADQAFAAVLKRVREHLGGGGLAQVAIIDRAAKSAVAEIERAIGAAELESAGQLS